MLFSGYEEETEPIESFLFALRYLLTVAEDIGLSENDLNVFIHTHTQIHNINFHLLVKKLYMTYIIKKLTLSIVDRGQQNANFN